MHVALCNVSGRDRYAIVHRVQKLNSQLFIRSLMFSNPGDEWLFCTLSLVVEGRLPFPVMVEDFYSRVAVDAHLRAKVMVAVFRAVERQNRNLVL